MTFLTTWFAPWQLWAAWLPFATIFVFCLQRFLRQTSPPASAWAMSTTMLALLWLMNVQIDGGHLNGMSYHLLALNLIALILGAPAAFLLGSIWLLAFGLLQQRIDFLPVFALNALWIVLPPIALNAALRRLALRRLPHHVFVYIFINGFITGALGMMLTGLLVASLLNITHVFTSEVAWGSAFPVFFLLSWGEAFLSGIGAAVCVAFKPDVLTTFTDEIYLTRNNQIWK
ncbi:energy-coupling factor ABC transporter permease [Neisseriaceae bacterium B1]